MTENELFTTISTTPGSTSKAVTVAPLSCPPGSLNGNWIEAEEKCYKIFRFYSDQTKKLDWYEADSYCKKLNGHLASFTSVASINKVLQAYGIYSTTDVSIWIGLNKLQGGYEWTDGTPSNFFNWDFGQPDDKNDIQNCVEQRSNARWRDAFCYVNKDWMCSLPLGVNPNEGVIEPEASIESNQIRIVF